MKPTLNGRYLFAEKELTLGDDPLTNHRKAILRFQAEDIRKERTGVHAKVHIMVNNISVAWDQFNVERHADRRSLVNHAYKGFGSNPPFGYANDVMLFDFGEFCEHLWIESLNIHQAEEMAGDPNLEQRFLCNPFVLEGAGTILFAPGGKGKSYTALLLAICIDAGIDIFWPVEIAKVMYINLERSRASMQRRLGMVNRALGLDERRPLLFFNGRGQSLPDISEHLSAEIEKKHVEVIVLDSISRTGQGDLIQNQIANKIADTLNGLCPTWLGIAHTPRADEKHIFGSAHFDNAADMTIRLHSVQEETKMGIGLEITKANDVPWQSMNLIGFDFNPGGLQKVCQLFCSLFDFE